MNLKELDSFRLSDAVTFHDDLNPKLWNNNNLRPEVKLQLKLIARDFLEELGIQGIDVEDLTVSGSNAAYSYTPHSDLDLHILVDMSKMPNDEIYKELFNAKKSLYNDSHDIKIHGVPVELYVQDAREPVVSLGEYSILNDKWLRIPTKRRANFDQTATKAKYEKLLNLIEIALKTKKYSKVQNIIKTIRRYRQAGLDNGGEFGPENLAYKALRSQGYITKLYDLKDKLHSELLTIETMYQDPTKIQEEKNKLPEKVYHVTPTSNLDSIMKAGLRPQVGARSSKIQGEQSAIYCFPDKASLEDAMMNWLGDEFDEDEELAIIEIDTRNLTGEYTPNAEFEIAITSLVPPNRIKVLSTIDEDYDPNGKPPGPEFKPTMPAGTVKVDVSDVYDWYKLGQHISNLKGLGKHDFGKGPPSTIMAFGDEDLEHQYINDLEKTGLTTTDIDPVDPNQPKGMKRQKVDPTYNVNEGFDQPYPLTWEKSEYGDVDALAKLPDGSPLSIMFNNQQDDEGEEVVQVEFYRNNSQEVTGEGDAMRVFATVLTAIQQYVKKYKPVRLTFSARKEVEQGQNPESRAKLYDRLVQRYSKAWGYRAFRADNGDLVIYELSNVNKKVAEDETLQFAAEKTPAINPYGGRKDIQYRGSMSEASGYIPSEKEKNDPRFKTALTVDVHPDSIKKNAKAFGWLTSRAGIPPTAKANGKI